MLGGKSHMPGLFEGQRPSPIPAYVIAIGIRHGHDRRAESPVSCLGFVSGTDGSGLQPSNLSFAGQNLGRYPRLVSSRAVGAGEGGRAANGREWGEAWTDGRCPIVRGGGNPLRMGVDRFPAPGVSAVTFFTRQKK